MAAFAGWEAAVLRGIGAPTTAQNVAFLDTWQSAEGGTAAYNPLNTTQPSGGASNYNSVGVKNYPSAAAGAEATAATLTNGRYGPLVAALRSGDPYRYAQKSQANVKGVADSIYTWGTHTFALQFAYKSSTAGGFAPPAVGESVTSAGTNPVTGQTVTSVTKGPSVLGGILPGWLTDPTSWLLRGMEIIAGGVLVLAGLYLLARQIGLAPDAPTAVKTVAAVAK